MIESALRQESVSLPTTIDEVVIIDAGVPHARAMREALALIPAGAQMDRALQINPFDPSFHNGLAELSLASCSACRSQFSVA